MTLTPHQQQMRTDTARGDRAGHMCRFTLAVDNVQDRPLRRAGLLMDPPCGVRLMISQLGPGLRAPALSHSIAHNGALPIAGQLRRTSRLRWRFAVPLRRTAVKFSAALEVGRSHQFYRIAHKLGGNRPNPFHRSTSCLSDDTRDNEALTQNVGILFQRP